MPADLDDIFASVARQADVIPLGTADQARRRGRQRTRNGALIGVAAAVCVVLTGVGVAVRPDRQSDGKTVAPGPSTTASVGALPLVGAPIPYDRTVASATPAIAGGRVFSSWLAADNSVTAVAASLSTGAVEWKVQGVGGRGTQFTSVNAVPQGALVAADQTLNIFDPAGAATGATDGVLTVADLDELVMHEKFLIRRWGVNGQIDAYNWRGVTAKHWSVDAGADLPVHILGMRTGSMNPQQESYTDNRLLVVLKSGKVQVRDVTNGALLRTITPVSLPQAGNNYLAYDGWLYEVGHPRSGPVDRVVAMNVDTGASAVVVSGEPDHSLTSLDACGPGRVCVLNDLNNGVAQVWAVDVGQRRKLWSALAPGAGSLSASGGYVVAGGGASTKVFDPDGKEIFRTAQSQVDWLDAGRLLMLPTLDKGEVSTVRIADGKVTRLGTVPARTDTCVHTADRLACATTTDLRIYRLNG